MKINEMTAIASALIIMLGLFWYIKLIISGNIRTVVASWIVSTTALTLSLVTYFSSPKATLLGGMLNGASALAVFSTLIAVYLSARYKNEKIEFNSFQKKCLLSAFCITVLWIVLVVSGGTGVVPNLLTQILLIVSYTMLIVKFWKAEKNTESLFTWWCVFVSSIIGLYPAWQKNDWLAFIYATRSTVMCGALVYTLHRIGWKNKWAGIRRIV